MEGKINCEIILNELIIVILFATISLAQPSGGPYGPQELIYSIPQNASKIIYVAPDASTTNSGSKLESPTTIEKAFKIANTGDVMILRGGVYRTGNLITNQGFTIQPYKNEKPILKGTYVAEEWINLGNGLWTTKWEHLFPQKPDNWWRRHREGKKTPLHRFNNDMVFVDGKFLQSVGWEGEVDKNTFFIDYDTKTIYIGIDPTDKLVEITAYNVAILRTVKPINEKESDKKGYTIKGVQFLQYAYRALEIEGKDPEGLSDESLHGKDVVGTTLENCTISYCSRVAGYLRGDNMTIRNCLITDTSTEGLYILSSNDVLLEKNIIKRNNIERITGYYPAAVKIFNQCYRVICNDNLVLEHPYSNGIWYDVGNVDGVFTNNWIEGVGNNKTKKKMSNPWPSDNGFFFEISSSAVCSSNVFINCDQGIFVLNSSDVKIFNNTLVNSMVCIGRNERSAQGDHFGWHPSTGPDVDERIGHVFKNNLLTADRNHNRPLLYVWQSDKICDKIFDDQLSSLNQNLYVTASENKNPIIWFGPFEGDNCIKSFNSVIDFNKIKENYSSESEYLITSSGVPYKSSELKNFELNSSELKAYNPRNTLYKSVGAYNLQAK